MKFRIATTEEEEYFEHYLQEAMTQGWNWKKSPAINLLGRPEPPEYLKQAIEDEEITFIPPRKVTLYHHLLQFPDGFLYDCICYNEVILDYSKRPKQ